ncbi:unnamed protein product [Cunninghamella echinulata]
MVFSSSFSTSLPKIKTTSVQTLGEGKWLSLELLSYIDTNGITRPWERCIRKTTSTTQKADAVDIIAHLKTKTGSQLLLVVQYRPALEKYTIEFPSGLIDENETPIDAAQRELLEETGYKVDKNRIQLSEQPVCYEPGLTNSTCYVAQLELDITTLDHPPQPQLEDDEWSLNVLLLPIEQLITHLKELENKHGLVIDSRVYSFACGLAFSHNNKME